MNSPPRSGLNLPAVDVVYAVFEELTLAARAHSGHGAGGLLVLYALADEAGAAVALGTSIAGGAVLGIDPDAERLKLAVRNAVCDFAVNHLNEALRILKNEVRKKTPVSVGLVGLVEMWVTEMAARGVQPDFLASTVEPRALFVARGARLLALADVRDQDELEHVWWSVGEAPVRWLPVVDSLAANSLKNADAGDMRLRWLRTLPRYMARASEHYLRMMPSEASVFVRAIEAARASGAVAVPLKLRRTSAAGSSEVQL
ncbi:MAG TPA: hypothetical protein VGD64_11190 [Acidisarcina sp.]